MAFYSKVTRKRWKYDNIPYGACVKLEVYDVWHHRIRKLPFPSVNEKPAFKKISAV